MKRGVWPASSQTRNFNRVATLSGTTLLASMQGYNPSTAIEFGRKVLYSTERPSFTELEAYVKRK